MPDPTIALWSPKGGSGTSVTAAALAIHFAKRQPTVLVDGAGDQAAICGFGSELGHGEMRHVLPNLVLADRGIAADDPANEQNTAYVYDLGDAHSELAADVLRVAPEVAFRNGSRLHRAATATLCVTRADYLALRRAMRHPALPRTTGVVLVSEPERPLGADDVCAVLDLPIVATIPMKPAIARSVDAGVLAMRVPDPLARAVTRLAAKIEGVRA